MTDQIQINLSEEEAKLIGAALDKLDTNNKLSRNVRKIAIGIHEKLHENSTGSEEEFDPYRDDETRAMLERAGIATHRFRR